MTRYLLDATPLTAYVFGRRAAVRRIDPWLVRHEVATSILVYAEVVEYLRSQSHYPERHQALRELLFEIQPLELDYPILERYSLIRRQLRPPHGPGLIGDIDTLIAATAIEYNLTIVSCDTDYARVPDLKTLLIPRSEFRR